LVDTLQRHAVPQDKDWFAYKFSEESSRQVVAESLRGRTGIPFRTDDIHMTAGAFGAIGVTMRALCEPGDEVIFLSPPWFFYELMIASAGATAVRVRLAGPTFDLDPDAVAARSRRARGRSSSTHRTTHRAGSTASPSWPPWAASWSAPRRNGRPIVLLSDESYNRIVFDGIRFHSPAQDYAATITIYTYGKTLLAPGQRIGYAALNPDFPDAGTVNQRIMVHQLAAVGASRTR
jgi:aspartate aminotransferase